MISTPQPETKQSQITIACWLLVCCAMVFAMVVLGGVTRLTGSGLSIVEWGPIMGAVPPLSELEWQSAFEQYRQFPEYKIKNQGMNLLQFKSIFWFEYSHRLLGRAIGLVFLFPFLYFLARHRISRNLIPKLIVIFFLGGLQGLLGWYMVKSGLVGNPNVSQYRLTAHLAAAFAIYGYMLWVALGLLYPRKEATAGNLSPLKALMVGVTTVTGITVLSGGFVAGLKAGHAYNTFPLMDGHWIPEAYSHLEPWWKNLFENIAAVQFDHRLMATITFVLIVTTMWQSRNFSIPRRAKMGIHILLATVLLQVGLGISTLLLHVPIPLAATHQAGAMVLFTVALFTNHSLR